MSKWDEAEQHLARAKEALEMSLECMNAALEQTTVLGEWAKRESELQELEKSQLRNKHKYIKDLIVDILKSHNSIECEQLSKNLYFKILENLINNYFLKFYLDEVGDDVAYDRKRIVVLKINDLLRDNRIAIRHRITREPCLLVAVANTDGTGRYVLEDRLTKKRSMTCKTISDLCPFELMSDLPRKEGVIEQRKKRAGEDED